MKELLERLYAQEKLSREECKSILRQMSEGKFSDPQLAAFLSVFRMRPIEVKELQGFRDALLELAVPVSLDDDQRIDIVGTGGDGKNTFNISTLSCFVVAGAGYKVSKHGNYGVSSACGSSNVLEHLGYRFSNQQDDLKRDLEKANMCFLHAPFFHPAMKAVGPVRRALGVKTFFNMLGPLVNPSRPRFHFLGVYDNYLTRLYQYILHEDGGRFAVIYGLDGYDEVSLTGDFVYKSNEEDKVRTPEELGFEQIDPEEIYGGETVEEAAKIFTDILETKASTAQQNVVLANAGLAIQLFHPDKSLEACISEARESLESGKALECLKKLVS